MVDAKNDNALIINGLQKIIYNIFISTDKCSLGCACAPCKFVQMLFGLEYLNFKGLNLTPLLVPSLNGSAYLFSGTGIDLKVRRDAAGHVYVIFVSDEFTERFA